MVNISLPVDNVVPLALRERHYTCKHLAEVWGFSENYVRSLVDGVPGVLKAGTPETRRKRGYVSIRVPESVALQVYRKLQAGEYIQKKAA